MVAKIVLLTGCSSGIGQASAQALTRAGYIVFAGMRQPEQASLPQDLTNLYPLQLDVTSESDWQAALATIAATQPETLRSEGLYALVNNAGVGYGGPVEHLPLEIFREQFEVNYFAVITGVQACLDLLRQGRPGRIVNISSVNGRIVTPFLAPYCSSKFALEALTESLRSELAPWQITCSLILPGMVRTPIFAKSQSFLAELKARLPAQALLDYAPDFRAFESILSEAGERGSPPEAVAATLLQILASPHPRLRYSVGQDARWALLLQKLLPEWAFEHLLRRVGLQRRRR